MYQTYFPKVDPTLVHSLLMSIEENPEKVPFYMVEIFTKPGTDAEKIKVFRSFTKNRDGSFHT